MMPPKSGGTPKQLMVLLHGYGADGQDLISLGFQWRDLWPDMLFVAPNAPTVCDQMPGGFQWFAPEGPLPLRKFTGVPTARDVVVNFLIDLWAQTGISPADTVLAGFSQGAMMALHVGTSLDQQLAGIVAFSGAFVPPLGFDSHKFARPPVALIHGDMDAVVDPTLSRQAREALQAEDFDVMLHISPGTAHGIAPDGLDFATSFLLARMAAKA
jgi:phospholipase/carboxylesterase